MTSSGELIGEHRVILSVLLALEQRIAAAAQSRIVPVAFLRDVVRFSREFVDRCHHAKEEGCLFPCLVARGMPREGGLLTAILDEHATGRALVARIADLLDRYERAEIPVGALLDSCRAYADLLRQHIAKEDDVLFPIGDGLMTAGDHGRAGRCYAEREAAMGPAHGQLEGLALRLSAGGADGERPLR